MDPLVGLGIQSFFQGSINERARESKREAKAFVSLLGSVRPFLLADLWVVLKSPLKPLKGHKVFNPK